MAADKYSVPKDDASLTEIMTFLDSRDFAANFRKLWGDDYAKNAEMLWQRCTHAFKEGDRISMSSDELLLCLKYDSAIAPYLPRSEPERLLFYRRLLAEIRKDGT